MASPDTMEYNPIRELGELCDHKGYTSSYTTDVLHGNSYVIAEVQVGGTAFSAMKTGLNKRTAKKLAAKPMLKRLKKSDGLGQISPKFFMIINCFDVKTFLDLM